MMKLKSSITPVFSQRWVKFSINCRTSSGLAQIFQEKERPELFVERLGRQRSECCWKCSYWTEEEGKRTLLMMMRSINRSH